EPVVAALSPLQSSSHHSEKTIAFRRQAWDGWASRVPRERHADRPPSHRVGSSAPTDESTRWGESGAALHGGAKTRGSRAVVGRRGGTGIRASACRRTRRLAVCPENTGAS